MMCRNKKFADTGRSILTIIAVLSATILAGALAPSPAKAGARSTEAISASAATTTGIETDVKIDNCMFAPQVVTVKAGTQVTWTNKDDIPHTVDSTDEKFRSSALDTDDKFQVRFTEAGEDQFFCRMHPKMTGKIIVQP
jgi:plastocyanin